MRFLYWPSTRVLRIFVVSVCAVLLATGAYAFMYHAITTARATLRETSTSIAGAVTRERYLRSMKSLARSLESDHATFSTFFVQSDQVVLLLDVIERFQKATGATVSISSVREENLAKNEGDPPEPVFTLTIDASGSWSAVYHVLSLLETLPYVSFLQRAVIDQRRTDATHVKEWHGIFEVVVAKDMSLATLAAPRTSDTSPESTSTSTSATLPLPTEGPSGDTVDTSVQEAPSE